MFTNKRGRGRPLAASSRPVVRFAIVGNPRTGSSHLASLLDSHPDIACWDDEIFDAGEAFDASGCDLPIQFLQCDVLQVKARAVGFKLLWDAFDRLETILDALEQLDFVLLHVYRSNLLDSFISFQLATLNDAFTSWDGTYDVARFEADYDQCLEWFELCEARDAKIRHRAQEREMPTLEVEYNELGAAQGRILDFLQMPRHDLTSRMRKQREGSQSDAVTNYGALRERFAGSRWAELFVG
jgi:LPS sulfotransferase NodH